MRPLVTGTPQVFSARPGEKVRPLSQELTARFKGRRCWAGVDLSMTTDLSAVALVFPCDDAGFDVLSFFWMPEEAVRQRERRDGMPYQRWADQGIYRAFVRGP